MVSTLAVIAMLGICAYPDLTPERLESSRERLVDAEAKGYPDHHRQYNIELSEQGRLTNEPLLRFKLVNNLEQGVALIFDRPALMKGVILASNSKDELYFRLPGQRHIQTIQVRSRLQDFMGTQFNLNDLNSLSFTDGYEICGIEMSRDNERLMLRRRLASNDQGNPYINLQINRVTGLINRIDYIDKSGRIERRQERRKLVKVSFEKPYFSEIVLHDFKSDRSSIVRVVSTDLRDEKTYGRFDKRWIARVARSDN
ncbi:MAG: outer membrane lipoprotein-sorting protein [Deltaproteobacteria bacterium]|jgi:hypothetical protein|nr:outer membrane lipoprotein-sorting protein [Deltaproteobacteria bacterium]